MWKVTISASSWRRWRSESANIDMSFLGWRGEGTLVNGAAEAAGGGHYTHQAGVWPSLPTPWGAPHERTAPPEGAAPLRGRERGSDLASVAGGAHGARLHGLVDVLQAGRIVDGGGNAVLLAIGDVTQQLAQDLARAGLGQAIHHQHLLETGDGADLLAHQGDKLLLQRKFITIKAILGDNQPDRNLPPEGIMDTDNGTLGYGLVGPDDFFHFAGREPVSGNIDDIIGATHDEKVTILVKVAAIASQVVARISGHIGALKTLGVLPNTNQAAGRQRLFDDHAALLHHLGLFAFMIQQLHIEPGYRYAGAAGLGRQQL